MAPLSDGDGPHILHASAVALNGQGLLITGRAGAGKSTLALELMALGAALVADDRVHVAAEGGKLTLSAPESISGLVEARGLGILAADPQTATAAAVVTLDEPETERLPAAHETVIAGVTLPLLRRVESPAFASMLTVYLKGGRAEP